VKHSYSLSFAFVLFLSLFNNLPTHASDYLKEVILANDLYSEKKYMESAQAYEALIQKGVHNGYLFYNLGNTYIRMGNKGAAILNYIRAQKLIPRDENLGANLRFAIQQTQDKIEPPPPGTLATLFFWSSNFNLSELINLTMVLNFIFWVNLALWMFFRSPTLKIARNTLLCFLLLSFISIGVKLINISGSELGVVLAKRVEVRSGRAMDAITLFQLHEGALVTITGDHENWLEVRLNDEQKGWVPKTSIGT
jgi:tetratricopeptide (TPR) repeat protein